MVSLRIQQCKNVVAVYIMLFTVIIKLYNTPLGRTVKRKRTTNNRFVYSIASSYVCLSSFDVVRSDSLFNELLVSCYARVGYRCMKYDPSSDTVAIRKTSELRISHSSNNPAYTNQLQLCSNGGDKRMPGNYTHATDMFQRLARVPALT